MGTENASWWRNCFSLLKQIVEQPSDPGVCDSLLMIHRITERLKQTQTQPKSNIRREHVQFFCHLSNSLAANSWHSKSIHESGIFINDHVSADLCSKELKSINHKFPSCVIGMCMCVCVCLSVFLYLLPPGRRVSLSRSWTPPSGLLYIARGAAGVVFVWLGGVVHLPNDLSEQFVYHGFALG